MKQCKVALVAHGGNAVPDWVIGELDRERIVLTVHECTTDEELAHYAGDADIVWLFSGSRVVTAENLALLRHCGAIVRTGSGTDNVPVAAATASGIVVANTPDATKDTVADHAVALLFAAARQIAFYDRNARAGIWHTGADWSLGRIYGQSLGLIGFGRIAQGLARRMRGFELSIGAYDPQVPESTMIAQGVHAESLDDLLARSDFVSLHCPLTAETYHLLSERELRLMRPTAILINTARGPIVDEPALVRALTEGWIRAAALDVLEQEPPPYGTALLGLDNVVITPHVAAYSDEFLHESWRLSLETVIALAQGHWPLSYVNGEVRPRMHLTPRPLNKLEPAT